MQDWNSSDESYRSRFLSIKFLFILMGAALWEYARTFDYEWGVYRGRRKYLWTVWCGCLPSSPRKAELSSAIARLIVACSALNMRSLFFLRAGYDPQSGSCVPFGSFNHVPCTSAVLITDLALITLMLVASESGLIRYLYRQGIVWMALAVIAGVPAVVAAAVKLNAGVIMMYAEITVALTLFQMLNFFETTVLYVEEVISMHTSLTSSVDVFVPLACIMASPTILTSPQVQMNYVGDG
ncbi:hypothetical protein PENSPDRAFT_663197 [Peniophora sp. CONT]|nr:hypothetical protein PENSPDRAFT_663197 [Peniophora sp. CONT]